ncbi:Eukaryotic translation initiation factor 2C, partial [Borealophlyctis nickersoniae]
MPHKQTHEVSFPKRPDVGQAGQRLVVRSNFYPILRLPPTDIYQYDVEIEPTAPQRVNRQVFQMAVDAKRDEYFRGDARFSVYDGRKIMYSPTKLPLTGTEAAVVEVILPEDNGNGARSRTPAPRRRDPRKFKITIKYAVAVSIGMLSDMIQGKLKHDELPLKAITALEIIVRHYPSFMQGVVTAGKGFYMRSLFARDPDRELNIKNGVEAWNGLKLSVKAGTKLMMLNADLGATTFMKSGPLIEIIADIMNRRDSTELRSPLREQDCQRLQAILKNFRVETTHRAEYKRKYKIAKITSNPADRTTFTWEHDGKKDLIAVAEYFKTQYDIKLKFPHLPCVVAAQNTYLPVEVCAMLPGQRVLRKLDDVQTSNMIKITQKKPHDRLNRINDGVNQIVGHFQGGVRTNDYLQAFSIDIGRETLEVESRILPAPTISYGKNSRERTVRPNDGVWNLKDKQVAAAPEAGLDRWSVIAFIRKNPAVYNFIGQLVQTCERTGLKIVNREPPVRFCDPRGNIEGTIKNAYIDATGPANRHKPQLILIVLPDSGQRLYAEIKRVGDTVVGVATQCLQSKHVLGKPNVQYCANVCLKINAKLGGYNSYLGKLGNNESQLPFISERPTIVIGADITHPGAFDSTRPSIAALVGSVDAGCTKFASAMRIQRPRNGEPRRQDVIQDVKGMVVELLKAFYEENRRLPELLLYYRDGVSDGQFANVQAQEVSDIALACHGILANYSPKITFVVVQKRHSARFFPIQPRDGDRSGNVKAGTVIDTTVVDPKDFDFYLNSHAGLQGTSRPAHYYVLEDQNNFTSDAIQQLTYRLCYLYARATRSVSVVPPVYYADLVCQRARFYFRDTDWSDSGSSVSGDIAAASRDVDAKFAKVHEELKGKMFF